MTRRKQTKGQAAKHIKAKSTIKETTPDSWIDTVIVLMYAMVELFPKLMAVDVMGSQWLYLSVVNVLVGVYIISKKKFVFNFIVKSAAFITISGLLIVSALSFFVSYNVIESVVTYSRLFIVFFAFTNLLAIINSNKKTIPQVLMALAIMVILQSLFVISKFYSLSGSNLKLDEIILAISGNTGNKNFLGVSILLKIPFVVYMFHRSGGVIRILAAAGIFVSCLALFIINSRSTYIGLLAESGIYAAVMIFFFMKEKSKQSLWNAGIYLIMIFLAFGLTQLTFSNLESKRMKGSYGSVTERIESIGFSNEGSSGRVRLWQSAIDFISKHPILGGGYGNWKVHSVPYEATTIRGFGIRKHVHNDYLEVTADTGLFGGLLFATFLAIFIFYSVKILTDKNQSNDTKLLAAILLMAHVAYMSDSMFNFPMERPNLFLLMMFSAASILTLFFTSMNKESEKQTSVNYHRVLTRILLVISVVSVYISVQVYKSMAAQNKVFIEWFGKTRDANPPFKSDEVNPLFPSIPNLNEVGMPIANMKAKYLAQEGKYKEALTILNEDKQSNPYLYFAEFIKANIALSSGQIDTGVYYAKLAYYNRPANQQLYDLLYDLSRDLNDTMEMKKAFGKKTSTRPEATDYFKHSQSFYTINKNTDIRLNTLQDGLKKFPKDSTLNFQFNFVKGLVYFNQQNNAEAISLFIKALSYQDSPFANQNIGYGYFNMGKFSEAIPYLSNALSSGQFRDGRTEYYRGRCYLQLSQFDKACLDFKQAAAFGYPVESQLIQGCN